MFSNPKKDARLKKVRMGILGCGRIALATHLPTLRRRPDVQIIALAEPNESLRGAALAQVPDALGCADWREVLENRDVDAVLIALPTSLHAEAAIAALGAGMHIYLEKPIAATLADSKRVIDAWRSSNCIGATGFNYRFHPLISALRQQIQARRVGQVVAIRGSFATPDRALPAWNLSRATGGGVLLDLASHHIDLLRYVLTAEVQSVNARIIAIQSEADTATMDLQLSGNIVAQLFISLRCVDENRIEIFGLQGKLAVDCYRSVDVEYSGGRQGAIDRIANQSTSIVHRAAKTLELKLSGSNMQRSYQRALEAFVTAVASGKQPECDLNAGHATLAVIDAAERSAQSGESVMPDQPAATEVTTARAAQSAAVGYLPSLTVVAVTMDCYETLRKTVRHLAAQTIHQRIELLICAPSCGELQLNEREMQPFHSFGIFESGHGCTVAAAKVPAVHAARAPLVIFAEDHSFPEPTWAEELVSAHEQGAVAAGPQICNANPQSMMSWADLFLGFGPWVEPRPHGPVARLPWHNSAYDREVLVSLGDELEALIENEGLLHERLRADGKKMYLVEARTGHVNVTRPRSFCRSHYHGGRTFGAGRARDGKWNLARRMAHVVGAPLVPLKRLRSSMIDVKQCGRTRELLPRMLPLLLLGLCCHALGEAAGIAWGPGDSVLRKSDLEFHRERHISDTDAMALGFRQSASNRSAPSVRV
jgi:predicted dehydrogenase